MPFPTEDESQPKTCDTRDDDGSSTPEPLSNSAVVPTRQTDGKKSLLLVITDL